MRELTADRLEPGSGFEITVEEGSFHVLFHYDWKRRDASYDGEGVGETFTEAALGAIADAEADD